MVIGPSGVQLGLQSYEWLTKLTTAKQESNLLIMSMITNRIGQQEVLLPINHNHCNFQKQQIHSGQISLVETTSTVKKFLHFGNSSIFSWISGCCYAYCD